jgi:hypothetical protein
VDHTIELEISTAFQMRNNVKLRIILNISAHECLNSDGQDTESRKE